MSTITADHATVVPEQRGGVAPRLLEQVAGMADDQLTERARELAGEISAAEANLAAVLAEVERRGIHSQWECRTIERFAGWHLQYAPARTQALATVGRSMAELPVMAEAVADGSLSFDKARSIAKVAAPDTEGALVEMALHATVGQTQRICGQWRKVEQRQRAEPDDPGTPLEARPMVMVVRDDDGIELTIRFDHVRGELVLASIDAAARQVRLERADAAPLVASDTRDVDGRPASDEDRCAERLSPAEWRAEGLLRLAETSSAEVPEGLRPSGFDTTVLVHVGVDTIYGSDMVPPVEAEEPAPPAPPPDPPPDRRPPWALPPPAEVASRRDTMAELEPTGVKLRRDLARWLACDAGILTVIEDADGNPLHLGRRTASVPAAIRRAVHARYRTCAWPGCTATAVQMHHSHHRAVGGHDDVEGIVPECGTHHRWIHLHGIWITIDPDGTVHHWRPDGTEILANPTAAHAPVSDAVDAPPRLALRRLELGADPGETARQPRWQGDPLQLGECIAVLQSRRDAALRRTVPTRVAPTTGYDLPPPSPN